MDPPFVMDSIESVVVPASSEISSRSITPASSSKDSSISDLDIDARAIQTKQRKRRRGSHKRENFPGEDQDWNLNDIKEIKKMEWKKEMSKQEREMEIQSTKLDFERERMQKNDDLERERMKQQFEQRVIDNEYRMKELEARRAEAEAQRAANEVQKETMDKMLQIVRDLLNRH